jgi:hypothetical protein
MARSSNEYKSNGITEELSYIVELKGFPVSREEIEQESKDLALEILRREIRLRKRLIQTGIHSLPHGIPE